MNLYLLEPSEHWLESHVRCAFYYRRAVVLAPSEMEARLTHPWYSDTFWNVDRDEWDDGGDTVWPHPNDVEVTHLATNLDSIRGVLCKESGGLYR